MGKYRTYLDNFNKVDEEYINYVDYTEDLEIGRPYQYLVEMGLIKTYPTQKLRQRLESDFPGCKVTMLENDKNFNLTPVELAKVEKNPYIIDKIIVENVPESESGTMDSICSLFGYKYTFDKTHEAYILSPKFDEKYKIDNGHLPPSLFHVTPASNYKKIKKVGFCPYNKKDQDNSNIANYDPRVYFFTEFDKDLFASYARQSKHFSKEYDEESGELNNNLSYAVFVVNTNRIPDNVEFHIDTEFPGGCACWTTSNIPPSAIHGFGFIELDA